ncbi:hypothetical protein BH23BAC1_BH23BAC1_31440 [soil metagenome]
MKSFKNILIPIDFSGSAQNAVQYALTIFKNHSVEIDFIYVNSTDKNLENKEIQKKFEEFDNKHLKHVPFIYRFTLVEGELIPELTNAVSKFGSDLMIMCTMGREDPSELSNTSSMICQVDCPVIVVPQKYTNHQIKNIGYANDYKEIKAASVLEPIWDFALNFKAKVFLFHIVPDKKAMPVPVTTVEDTLDYYLESLEHEYMYVSNEDVDHAINECIREKKIDLLVVLSRAHGKNKLDSEGKLITHLSRHSSIPILTLC